jgi:hypothetical protein
MVGASGARPCGTRALMTSRDVLSSVSEESPFSIAETIRFAKSLP